MSKETETRIDVREAISKARDSMKSVFQDRELERLLLEEVELSDDKQKWLITFGYDEFIPQDRRPPLASIAFATRDFLRSYKVVTIDAGSGEVEAIKIRKV